jgi:hypothetical protein
MDIVLVAVTLASLAIAVSMGIATWRALHLDRSSPDEAGGQPTAIGEETPAGERQGWTELPIRPATVAATLDVRPWPASPAVRAESAPLRRTAAGSGGEADGTQAVRGRQQAEARRAASQCAPAVRSPEAEGQADPVDIGRRVVLAFGIVSVAVLTVGSSAIALNHRAARAQQAASAAGALELVSLDHAREGDRLAIHGIIRNPARGDALSGVAAVVLLFDRRDAFLGAKEGKVTSTVLPPGSEVRFEVVLPDAARVGRYRVSFRTGAHALPHMDRRGAPGVSPAVAGAVTASLAGRPSRTTTH